MQVAKALAATKFDGLCFTGSSDKGKLVAAAAANNLVPCVLELGGKSPIIVDTGCDIDLAARKIVNGRFINAGQACVAPDYVLVQEKLSAQLILLIKKYIKEFWDDGKNTSDYGRIISKTHEIRLLELLKNHQGQVIYGNTQKDKITPTVIMNPSLDSTLMKEEIFGPILPVLTFQNLSDAIEIINNKDKPLVIYYFGPHKGANFKRLE